MARITHIGVDHGKPGGDKTAYILLSDTMTEEEFAKMVAEWELHKRIVLDEVMRNRKRAARMRTIGLTVLLIVIPIIIITVAMIYGSLPR